MNKEISRIKKKALGNNFGMKLPKRKEYGANSDERETFAPKQFDLDNKFEESNRK